MTGDTAIDTRPPLLRLSYGGVRHELAANPEWTLQTLAEQLAERCGVDPATIKLLRKKEKVPLVPTSQPDRLLSDTGLLGAGNIMMVASKASDIEKVRSQKELPRMRGFEAEAALSSARRRTASRSVNGPPTGLKYTFGRYQALELPGVPLHPPKEAALALLYRLASDPGIVGIMQNHRWNVGLLKEMPPEGKVGVSPVCILGLNVNKGQEIHLRLRTDDMRGFRRYLSIRDTLIHELTHMVWGDHDNNFKQLNSELQRECRSLGWSEGGAPQGTFTASRGAVFAAEEPDPGSSTVAPRKLGAFLGEEQGRPSEFERFDPATAAAEAAMKRLEASSSVPSGAEDAKEGTAAAAAAAATPAGVEGEGHGATHRDGEDGEGDAVMADAEAEGGGAGGDDAMGGSNGIPEAAVIPMAQASPEQPLDERNDEGMEEQGAQGSEGSGLSAHGDEGRSAHHQEGMIAEPSVAPAPENDLNVPKQEEQQQKQQQQQQQQEEQHAMRGNDPDEAEGVRAAHDDDDDDDDGYDEPENPAAETYRRVQGSLQSLIGLLPMAEANATFSTLATILDNVLQNPQEERYRRIRCSNRAFQSRVARHPCALQVLRAAGFSYAADGGPTQQQQQQQWGSTDPLLAGLSVADGGLLCLTRDDPGLLWLALSAVRDAERSVTTAANTTSRNTNY